MFVNHKKLDKELQIAAWEYHEKCKEIYKKHYKRNEM